MFNSLKYPPQFIFMYIFIITEDKEKYSHLQPKQKLELLIFRHFYLKMAIVNQNVLIFCSSYWYKFEMVVVSALVDRWIWLYLFTKRG